MDVLGKRVSIVMCTYNGERHLREQLDSVLNQTYGLHEIIIQDDGSTDGTMAIVEEYAARNSIIKPCVNKGGRGVNANFFSAMALATGDYIAICDQDDIWEPDKIRLQMEAIGGKLLCTCRSVPFSNDSGISLNYDRRCPNYGLFRLLFSSLPGHTLLFRRELLNLFPHKGEIFNRTYYDVILGITAAAYDSIVMVDRELVHQRRCATSDTYIVPDKRRERSAANGAYILWWAVCNYGRMKKYIAWHFRPRLDFLRAIKSDSRVCRDGVRLLECECSGGLLPLLRMVRLFVKYRHTLFYTYEPDPVALLRSLLYPLMQAYNYRYLLERGQPLD